MDQGSFNLNPPVAASSPERKALSVSELTTRIKGTLEPQFQNLWVQGEVSNFRPAASGHLYFSIKDKQASISVACFGWNQRRANFELRDGLEILVRGKISVYAARGNYQLVVDQIEPLGAGALQLAFEQMKQRLSAEGLFDSARKRPMPRFPKRVAVITSPSGAAIRDMLNILARRAPQIEVLVVPAIVQGDDAANQIMRALELVNRHRLGDIVVLARGGGSLEDLWCFNDERLARAISKSALPVISAVGHEIDFTISDFVSDLRAPTPSAAAELVSGHWVDVTRRLIEAKERLKMAVVRDLTSRRQGLQAVAARVVNPKDRLREQQQRCDELAMRLERAVKIRTERRRSFLEQLSFRLDALSPLRVLERGYTLVFRDGAETMVRSRADIQPKDRLRIQFHDGIQHVQAVE